MPMADVCCKHGISSVTFCKYKSKFGGREVSNARRLRALERENARLTKLLADQMLDNAMLTEISAKNLSARGKERWRRSCPRTGWAK